MYCFIYFCNFFCLCLKKVVVLLCAIAQRDGCMQEWPAVALLLSEVYCCNASTCNHSSTLLLHFKTQTPFMATVFPTALATFFVRAGTREVNGTTCISGGFLIGSILAAEKKNQCWHTARVDWKQRAWRGDENQGGTLMSSKVSIKNWCIGLMT